MGAKYTEAQREAAKRYLQKKDDIRIRVQKGEKEELEKFVDEIHYKSVNQFVVDAIAFYKKAVLEEKEK